METTRVPLPRPIPADLLEVWRSAEAAAPDLLLTGGAVRDFLLGRTVRDLDFATTDVAAAARALRQIFGAAAVPLGGPHNLYRIPLGRDGLGSIELTERGPLEEDARRRDLTVNALYAQAPATPDVLEVADLCSGLADLGSELLRAPSRQAFEADPVRVLRLARLEVDLGFSTDLETRHDAANSAHHLADASPERVRDELVRLFALKRATAGLLRLDALGALDIALPEMVDTKRCEQPKEHYWDVYGHSLACVEAADWLFDGEPVRHLPPAWRDRFWEATDWLDLRDYLAGEQVEGRSRKAMLKFACFLHDVAKPQTRTVDETGRTRFFGHASEGAVTARQIGHRLKLADRETRTLSMLVKEHLRPGQIAREGPPSNRALRRMFQDARGGIPDLLLLTLFDGMATVGPREQAYDFDLHLRYINWLLYRRYGPESQPPEPLIDGNDVMETLGLPSGRLVGAILSSVREAQLDGEIHTRNEALERARSAVERLDPEGTSHSHPAQSE